MKKSIAIAALCVMLSTSAAAIVASNNAGSYDEEIVIQGIMPDKEEN